MGRNEAETRYAMCNPRNYGLKLEESIRENLDGDDGDDYDEYSAYDVEDFWRQLAASATQEVDMEEAVADAVDAEEVWHEKRRSIGGVMSKVDYAVYTLSSLSGLTKVVAIIDAKRTLDPHSVAQVIGYYSAFEVGEPRPIVAVMSAYQVQLILFLFVDGSTRLVNAVVLEPIPLWNDQKFTDYTVAQVINLNYGRKIISTSLRCSTLGYNSRRRTD